MGPPVRQLWDHLGSGAAEGCRCPAHTRCQTVQRIWGGQRCGVPGGRGARDQGSAAAVAARWGVRSVARLARVDRKTVRRYVAVAQACSLDRAGGEAWLSFIASLRVKTSV